MDIHRLLIAHEPREGTIPLGAMFAGALKERGYDLRLFQIGFDEMLTRYLEIATGEPVTVIDLHMLHNDFNCKSLFQFSSKKEALHLFVGPLSEPQLHEEKLELHKTTAKIGEIFSLPVMPLLYADRNAILAARLTEQIFSQIVSYPGLQPLGVCFAAVLNPREYQLLEIEMGRRIPYFPLGYLPKNVIRDEISPELLFSEEPHSLKFMSLHSSVRQLAALEDMISWPVVGSFAKRASPWPEVREDLEEVSGIRRVGVLRHPALGGAGDGNMRFFTHLGASLFFLDIENLRETEECDFLYIPHGRAQGFRKISNLEGLKRLLGSVVFRKIPFLVEGESVALLGESILYFKDEKTAGISMFPFSTSVKKEYPSAHEVFLNASLNSPLLRKKETLHGYRSNGCSVSVPPSRQGYWSVRRSETGGEIDTDGWFMGKGVLSRTCFSLWEVAQGARKWLNLR